MRNLKALISKPRSEAGFTTAELLGNAALGIVALVAIWGLLGGLGQSVIQMISDQLGV